MSSPIEYPAGLQYQLLNTPLTSPRSLSTGSMDPIAKQGETTRRALATGAEKAYMAIAFAEAVIVFAIAWTYFALVQLNVPATDAKTRTVPVYIAIFIFAQLFSLLYVYDALRARNVIQLVLHTVFNLCILIYAILQLPQTRTALWSLQWGPNVRCGSFARCVGENSLYGTIEGMLIVTPIIVGIATVAYAFLIRRLYKQFGWAEFRLVGASPDMKRIHREYQTLVSLLKLLFFFSISFCLAFLILVITAKENTAEFAITIVAMPLTPIVILACGYALRKENKPLMGISLALMLLGLGYFIYKLTSMFLPYATRLYINTRVTMVMFACFAILILLVTFIYGCVCMSNFGMGLIEAHRNPENRTSLWSLGRPRSADEEKEGGRKFDQGRLVVDQ